LDEQKGFFRTGKKPKKRARGAVAPLMFFLTISLNKTYTPII
jgi:hypothetical protein